MKAEIAFTLESEHDAAPPTCGLRFRPTRFGSLSKTQRSMTSGSVYTRPECAGTMHPPSGNHPCAVSPFTLSKMRRGMSVQLVRVALIALVPERSAVSR